MWLKLYCELIVFCFIREGYIITERRLPGKIKKKKTVQQTFGGFKVENK